MGCDAILKPLQQWYDGPYRVVKCTDKTYTIEINGQLEVMSLDQLKPAHIDKAELMEDTPTYRTVLLTSTVQPATTSTRTTRSERHVHWPDRFNY